MHQDFHRPEELNVRSSSISSLSSLGHYSLNSDNFRLDFLDERLDKGSNRENYDEIDLVSECSTPSAYTPGRYLQICDLTPTESNETTLWPSSLSENSQNELHRTVLISQQEKSFVHSYTYHNPLFLDRQCRFARCLSNRFVILIAVCLIIALSALGGLSVVI